MPAAVTLPLPPSLDELAAAEPLALFLDFDGTLVDIADAPDAIVVPPQLVAGLNQLCARLAGRLALVTGRSLVDLEGHIGPVAIPRAGAHGALREDAEGRAVGPEPLPLPKPARSKIVGFARAQSLVYEEKGSAIAVHYRGRDEARDGLLAVAEAVMAEHGLKLTHGKCVVELAVAGADKGYAVEAFMTAEPFIGAVPVFIGDDVTDEDGFAAAERAGGFGIAVGEREAHGARYALDRPAAVHQWLGIA